MKSDSRNDIEDLQGQLAASQEEVQQFADALAQSWEELTLLYDLADSLQGVMDVEQVAQLTLDMTLSTLGVGGAAIFVWEAEKKGWQILRHQCLLPAVGDFLNSLEGMKLARRIAQERRASLVNDLSDYDENISFPTSIRNLVGVPLNPHGQAKGIFLACNKLKENGFTSGDLKLLTAISAQAGAALENAHLYTQLEVAFTSTVEALGIAIDEKSPWTSGHSERVSCYAVQIARELQLGEDLLERVYLSGLLHDVGKMGVPDRILDKPDKLTQEEFDVVKTHPERGARILRRVRRFEGDVLDGALCHHERVDGKGYPLGLEGNDIPFMGRLLAVADAFDAMTNERPYRPGMSFEQAIAALRDGAGSQWDAELVSAFVSSFSHSPP